MTDNTPVKSGRGKQLIYWALAFAIAGVLLYYSLRGIEWSEVWRVVSRANLLYVGFGLLISTTSLFLRAYRWRILLQAQSPVRVSTAFWATAAGYFGNNFLPARAGELVRTMMVSSAAGLGKTFVLTTALTERLADAITLEPNESIGYAKDVAAGAVLAAAIVSAVIGLTIFVPHLVVLFR